MCTAVVARCCQSLDLTLIIIHFLVCVCGPAGEGAHYMKVTNICSAISTPISRSLENWYSFDPYIRAKMRKIYFHPYFCLHLAEFIVSHTHNPHTPTHTQPPPQPHPTTTPTQPNPPHPLPHHLQPARSQWHVVELIWPTPTHHPMTTPTPPHPLPHHLQPARPQWHVVELIWPTPTPTHHPTTTPTPPHPLPHHLQPVRPQWHVVEWIWPTPTLHLTTTPTPPHPTHCPTISNLRGHNGMLWN